jgi:hypothetical protein
MAMRALTIHLGSLCAGLLLLAFSPAANAQSIYKCTKAGQVVYTDQPCPGDRGTLLHQADASDIIDQYLRLGQTRQAEQYAQTHGLQALYQQRLAAHRQRLAHRPRLLYVGFAAPRQGVAYARAMAAPIAAADAERLRGENDALRQQNALYQSQLSQPVYTPPPVYWNNAPPYRNHHPHNRPDWPPSKEPIFHPSQQLAGGRVKC